MGVSVAEQVAEGREARTSVPRSALEDWRPAADRTDPVAILRAQDASRVPGLVPVRHGRMAVSPFTFYRGAAAIMAADLASVPVTGIEVQLCGDAHLSNLGVFASPSRELLFDLNDFDETLRGPWEWDLLRLAASFTVAARTNGLDGRNADAITAASGAAYRGAMAEFAGMSALDVWYSRLDTAVLEASLTERSKKAARKAAAGMAKARTRTSLQAASKLTEEVDGRLRFRMDPPVLVPLDDVAGGEDADRLAEAIRQNFVGYVASLPDDHQFLLHRHRVVDVAHKVVGVGSVGTRAFVVLLQGESGEPLILQYKQAGPSVLEAHLPASPYEHHGRRVVEGQRMMQAASDIFLGWSRSEVGGHDYYWRQLRDMKGSAEVETMSPKALRFYAGMCGWSLARAHARSGPAAAIAAYLGRSDRFDAAVTRFARRYAELNRADFDRHAAAIADGTLPAQTGV